MNCISKLTRDFLWEEKICSKRLHILSWDIICQNKEQVGLGVKNISLIKIYIYARRLLSFLNGENNLWMRVIPAKYKSLHPWIYVRSDRSYWAIRNIYNLLKKIEFRISTRDITKVLIWLDLSISNTPLSFWPIFVNIEKITYYTYIDELISIRN